MADVLDKITDVRNAARPNSARVTVARSAAGTTLSCDNLTGWPTASKVHFVTYSIDTNSDIVAGTQLDCQGIVSGNNINSLSVIDGSDTGNVINDVVEMLPTAAWAQDLADGLGVVHERTGLMKSGVTYPLPVISSFANATHTHTNAAGGGTLGAAAVPALDYSVQTLSNPYKFHAYRNAALTPVASTIITMDTELFDTNNNYSTSTGSYTAPVSGFYYFSGAVSVDINGNANTAFGVQITINGSTILVIHELVNMYAGGYTLYMPLSALTQLTAGDTVQLRMGNTTTGGNSLSTGARHFNFFQGFLVSRT